jgi:hypothetical protein
VSRPIRIGILDSGVHATHPHIGGIAEGIHVTGDGLDANYEDRLGHGTAVASLIHHLNPAAELVVVKVFETRLATSLPIILRAIDWCLEHEIDVINLSLGTLNPAHRTAFAEAVEKVRHAGSVIVSALEIHGEPALPGVLQDVIGVLPADAGDNDGCWTCERHGKTAYVAPPYPRDIPGVSRERNLRGVSFAVARISAMVADARNRHHDECNWRDSILSAGCETALS